MTVSSTRTYRIAQTIWALPSVNDWLAGRSAASAPEVHILPAWDDTTPVSEAAKWTAEDLGLTDIPGFVEPTADQGMICLLEVHEPGDEEDEWNRVTGLQFRPSALAAA